MVLLLVSCGGGGSTAETAPSSPTPPASAPVHAAKGFFLADVPVQGLRYKSGSLEGFTDEQGGFLYEDVANSSVSFSIGNALLGTVQMTDKFPVRLGNIVTPFDLSENGTARSNLVRALHALNQRSDALTRIVISNPLNQLAMSWGAINWEQSDLAAALVRPLSDAASVGITHPLPERADVELQMLDLLRCVNSGTYRGMFYLGDEFTSPLGNTEVVVTPQGAIFGVLLINHDVVGNEQPNTLYDYFSWYTDASWELPWLLFGQRTQSRYYGYFERNQQLRFSFRVSTLLETKEVSAMNTPTYSSYADREVLPKLSFAGYTGSGEVKYLAFQVLPDNTVRGVLNAPLSTTRQGQGGSWDEYARFSGTLNGDELTGSGATNNKADLHYTVKGKINFVTKEFVGTVTAAHTGGEPQPYMEFPAQYPLGGCAPSGSEVLPGSPTQ
jgi:hypothetical protein